MKEAFLGIAGIIILGVYFGADQLNFGSHSQSEVGYSERDIPLIPGVYEITRYEKFVRSNGKTRLRTLRHDVVQIPDVQVDRWPEMYLRSTFERLASGTGDCDVSIGTREGNRIGGTVSCSGHSSQNGFAAAPSMEAEFEALRNDVGFVIKANGSDGLDRQGQNPRLTFDHRWVARRLSKEELEENGASGSLMNGYN